MIRVISKEALLEVAEIIGNASAARAALNASLKMRNPIFLRSIDSNDLFVVEGIV